MLKQKEIVDKIKTMIKKEGLDKVTIPNLSWMITRLLSVVFNK